ncbi:hypothetical protein PMAYCL1PPCAC_15505, partial [Pristionchus mayeri]
MHYRSLFIVSILGLLLISSLDAAKPAKGKKGEPVVLEESSVVGEAPTPKIFRPKNLKVVSAYDKCKMDCQKVKEQEGIHSYLAQLREELAAVEAALGEEAHLEEDEHES